MFPGLIYMYRPDVFQDAPLLRAIAIFPTPCSGIPISVSRWGPVLAPVFFCAAFALIAVAGKRIDARDIP
jgi:hypothetical protein